MDFIMVPLVTGIVFACIYGLFELFVRRKERLALIEKLVNRLDAGALDGKISLPSYSATPRINFGSLRAACLMIGIGLGLLVGVLLYILIHSNASNISMEDYLLRHLRDVCYGAPILLFGGLGLVVSYLIEQRNINEKK